MAASSGLSKIIALACFIAAALVVFSPTNGVVASADHELLGWAPATRSGCRGTIAECLGFGGGEFELDSEGSRRILAATRYISYAALQRDSVPCSRRGASYYNCKPGAQANPYTRGCSAITRCRS
ncbi:rapid alkalinization factor-like [Diospyros lotus]|uniref:rapid alkalinization factor-like n=1 Tax=Diospyros lotus TaxID=55363 RepID=UPI002253B37D|nr:rapid alkalinization factor-like [Diospyros lotus]